MLVPLRYTDQASEAVATFHHRDLIFDAVPLPDEYCARFERTQRCKFKWSLGVRGRGDYGPPPAALMSMTMIIGTEGRNYTWAQYEEWLKEAGFIRYKRIPLDSPGANDILVGHKP